MCAIMRCVDSRACRRVSVFGTRHLSMLVSNKARAVKTGPARLVNKGIPCQAMLIAYLYGY